MVSIGIEQQKLQSIINISLLVKLVESYEQAFGCSVTFSMPVNEIQFDENFLSRPLPQENRLGRRLLEDECESQHNEVSAPESLAQICTRV